VQLAGKTLGIVGMGAIGGFSACSMSHQALQSLPCAGMQSLLGRSCCGRLGVVCGRHMK
jgi:hypothetical protein